VDLRAFMLYVSDVLYYVRKILIRDSKKGRKFESVKSWNHYLLSRFFFWSQSIIWKLERSTRIRIASGLFIVTKHIISAFPSCFDSAFSLRSARANFWSLAHSIVRKYEHTVQESEHKANKHCSAKFLNSAIKSTKSIARGRGEMREFHVEYSPGGYTIRFEIRFHIDDNCVPG
jgi:hypothetical protein